MLGSRRVGFLLSLSLLAFTASQAGAFDPKLLPGDSEIVVTVNLQQILNSDLLKANKELVDQGKGLLVQQLENNPAKKYLDKAGFDLFRDLVSITFANNGSKNLEKNSFLVIEGKFDVPKFEAAIDDLARDAGANIKVDKVGSFRLIEVSPPEREKRGYATLVGNSHLVISPDRDTVTSAIQRVQANKTADLKQAVKSVLETVTNKQSLSIVASGPALAKLLENAPVPNADTAVGVLNGIDALSFAVTLTKDVQFQLGVNAKDEDTAKKLAAGGNLALLTVRTMVAGKVKEDPKLQPVLDIANTLRITSQGGNIVLRGEVTIDNIEKLKTNFPKIPQ